MAGVVAELGGSWSQWEQELDLRRLMALQQHFRRQPPVQAMVQAHLGIEAGDETPPEDLSDEDVEAEMEALAALRVGS